jgi:hypothetical protein
VLAAHEKEKKKILRACLEQRRHFSPVLVSLDGLLGRSQNLAGKLSTLLAEVGETLLEVSAAMSMLA